MRQLSAEKYFSEIKAIEVVFKTVERCNINCSYCYYFNGGNREYLKQPKYISEDTIKHVARFLAQGAQELGLQEIRLDFHGGEPMMQKKKTFDWMCDYLGEMLSPHVSLSLAMQTNATLVDDDWIDLFQKHSVHIGVSLDGPKEYNDVARLDHQGNSTYERTARGLELLNAAADKGRIAPVGVLCVVNPNYSARKTFNHFVDDLNLKGMDFLLPDYTHDDFDFSTVKQYGDFLCELFDAWAEKDYKNIQIRIICSALARLNGFSGPALFGFSQEKPTDLAFTILADGKLAPDDVLRTTPLWQKYHQPSVIDTSMYEFFDHEFFHRLNLASRTIPDACQSCCWARICGGGGIPAHQYSSRNDSINNPTVYCESLKDFYSHISVYLLNNGMSIERLQNALFREDELAQMQATVA